MAIDLKQLNDLLHHIESHIDLEHCDEVDERYRMALAYEDVGRPQLVVQFTFGKNWTLSDLWDKFERYT